MSQVEVRHGAATDIGLVRAVNEDSYLSTPPVFVVADGMGGHQGGDVASRIVIEEFERLADEGYDPRHGADAIAATLQGSQRRIEEYAAAQRAEGGGDFQAGTTAVVGLLVEDDEGAKWLLANLGDSRIYRYAAAQRAEGGGDFQAGTTAVVGLLVEDDEGAKWLLANLGDSRIYRYAAGALEQVSVDHSVVQELVDAGSITPEQAATHPARNVITRALGGADFADADYFLLSLPEVERLLLCSDGVTGMLDDAQIAEILGREGDAQDAADRLVAAAVEAGGRDNATAVVVDVDAVGADADGATDQPTGGDDGAAQEGP
jgi:serine/threonine protein phosphatase PrpC